MERSLERILDILGEGRPPDPPPYGDRPERLSLPLHLPGLARHAVLTSEIEDDVYEAGLFGGCALRGRDHLDPGRASGCIEAARRLSRSLPVRLAEFRNMAEPPGPGGGCRA